MSLALAYLLLILSFGLEDDTVTATWQAQARPSLIKQHEAAPKLYIETEKLRRRWLNDMIV